MSTASHFEPISVEDYLRGERTAHRKHEFVAGDVHAMAGGTVQHNRIASNVMGSLFGQLGDQKCQAFNSDMKVRIQMENGTRFYYPDASIVCEPNAPEDTFQDQPVVVVEVISDSTRRTDEYEKRDAYLSMVSMRVYVLIEQSAASALVYRRTGQQFDREIYAGIDAIIPLPEVDCNLPLKDAFRNVSWD